MGNEDQTSKSTEPQKPTQTDTERAMEEKNRQDRRIKKEVEKQLGSRTVLERVRNSLIAAVIAAGVFLGGQQLERPWPPPPNPPAPVVVVEEGGARIPEMGQHSIYGGPFNVEQSIQNPDQSAGSKIVNAKMAEVLRRAGEGMGEHELVHIIAVAVGHRLPRTKQEKGFKDCIEDFKVEVDQKIATDYAENKVDQRGMDDFVNSGMAQCADKYLK
jgi:hypothetical protein